MNTPATPPVPSTNTPPLNIGVYGTTRAGKTRFLYELLANWHRDYRIVEQSAQTARFLQEIEPDIKAYNQSRGTVTSVEGIQVVVRRTGDQQPWTLTFRDLRGEFLAKEIDELTRADADKQASLPRQVRECNSFVFFFDPTSEDAPDQIEAHHTRELRRAGQFIDYVLAQRQNRYLPILFVLTHLDRWESNPKLRARVATWIQRVNDKLSSAYHKALGKHFPPRLIDPEVTTLCIASVRAHEAEPVVDRLDELVRECDEFQRTDRRRLRGILATLIWTLGLFAILAVSVLWYVRDPQDGKSTANRPTQPPQEWTLPQTTEQLDLLDKQLTSHPAGNTLPVQADALSLNEAFRWLPVKLEATRDTPAFASLRPRLQSTLDRLTDIVQEKLVAPPGDPLEPRWQIVNTYLKDTPDAPKQQKLETLRRDAWNVLARQVITQEIASILKRRQEVGSTPLETITEVLSALRLREQEFHQARIGGLKARQTQLDDLRTAATFLEDRKTTRSYSFDFRLLSARLLGTNVSNIDRGLIWSAAGMELTDFTINLVPTPIDASEVNFRTRAPEYRIKLALGDPVKLKLLIWNGETEKYGPVRDFDLPAGPLRALGLPLLVPGQTTALRKVEGGGYEIKFELVELPRAPLVLEEASARLQGTSP